MKFDVIYNKLMESYGASAFKSKKDADNFIKFLGKNFKSKHIGNGYYQIEYTGSDDPNKLLEKYFNDNIKIFDRIIVLPGEGNTANVNIGDKVYNVKSSKNKLSSKEKQLKNGKIKMSSVKTPKQFYRPNVKSAIIDATKQKLFENKIGNIASTALLGGLLGANYMDSFPPESNDPIPKSIIVKQEEPKTKKITKHIKKDQKEEKLDINKLIKALIKVESDGDSDAIGDNGKAKGILQIWPSYAKDVNRVYKTDYKHDDAFDPKKAIDMTKKYLSFYGNYYQKKTGNPINYEVLAKIHNGGPFGYKNKNTEEYWNKVKKYL